MENIHSRKIIEDIRNLPDGEELAVYERALTNFLDMVWNAALDYAVTHAKFKVVDKQTTMRPSRRIVLDEESILKGKK